MTRTVRSASQLTMFDEPAAQGDMFDAATTSDLPVSKGPPSTRDEIHAALHDTIAMLQACDACPWNAWQVHFQTGLFKLRADWFAPDIADPLLAAFAGEADRLDFANALPEDGGVLAT